MTTERTVPTTRRRVVVCCAALVVVVAGVVVTRVGTGTAADLAGDALYAALVYLVLVAAAPWWRSRTVGAVAVALCWAVELAQLTGLPADVVGWWSPARYVLGTTFGWWDLVAYAVGVAVTLAVDVSVHRPMNAPSSSSRSGVVGR
ncbi:hypothetical protein AGMMS50218_04990 [Actinomycetota bacterium]|nr:hypothetical protein AGMMS50218_04990 [Actinomycetota bacterium]